MRLRPQWQPLQRHKLANCSDLTESLRGRLPGQFICARAISWGRDAHALARRKVCHVFSFVCHNGDSYGFALSAVACYATTTSISLLFLPSVSSFPVFQRG